MVKGCVSWVKACKDFFGEDNPVTVPEFKALTEQDKIDMHAMLAGEGYDLLPLITTKLDNAEAVASAA